MTSITAVTTDRVHHLRRWMRRRWRSRGRLAVVLAVSVLLATPAGAGAAVGDYSVPVSGTADYPGWWSPHNGGPYRASASKIDTGVGGYGVGDYRRWRLSVPHESVRIVGGRISGRVETPNSAFVLQLREGSNGGAVRNLLSSRDATSFSQDLVANHDWIEFGLYADAATTTSQVGANWITLTGLTLHLHDQVVPTIDVLEFPGSATWLKPGCHAYTIGARDYGSGMLRLQIGNITTGGAINSWQLGAPGVGLKPGPTSTNLQGCVEGTGVVQGVNVIGVSSFDYAGQRHDWSSQLRFDMVAPSVGGLPAAGAEFTTGTPSLGFSATDGDSGLGRIEAEIDNDKIEVVAGANATFTLRSRKFAPGTHRLVLHVSDAVGNVTSIERQFMVRDVAPPLVTVQSPGDHGDATPWLAASAVDAMSAIDAASWSVTINGQPLPVSVAGAGISGAIGTLSVGSHELVIAVADVHGNRAELRRSYLVDGSGAQQGLSALGGRSGVFVTSAPTRSVTYGREVRLSVTALSGGRPMASHRVELRLGGTVLASQTADVQGRADLAFVARRSGQITVLVHDSSVGSAGVALAVAPGIGIRTSSSSPRRGQVVRIVGRVTPVTGRRKVMLQARIDDSWYTLRRSVKVGRNGKFVTTVRSAVRGTVAVRVRMTAGGGWAEAYSNVRVLRVR